MTRGDTPRQCHRSLPPSSTILPSHPPGKRDMKRRTLPVVLVSAVACLVSACETQVSEDTPTSVDLLPALGVVEEMRIGSLDDPSAGFTRIRQVDVAENGEIYVLEASADE